MNHPTKSSAIKDVALFFAVTLGLSYFVFWGPLAVFKIPVNSFVSNVKGPGWALIPLMLGGFTPSLTALWLTWWREGRAGLKEMWLRTVQFKIGWHWYLAALGLVIACSTLQILLIYVLGGSFDFRLFLIQLPSFLPLLVIGPLSEELGWRGYAQTRLQTRWNPLVVGVVVGMVWALWHLPLFLMIGTSQHELRIPFIGFFCGVTSLSIMFAWLQNHTQDSIWTAIFFHWIYTYAAQVIASGVTRSPSYNWLEYLPFVLVAVFIAIMWGPRTTNRILQSWQKA